MNFENNLLQAILAAVVIAVVIIGYFTFQPRDQSSNQATNTDSITATNCNNYNANPDGEKFTPDFQKIKNRAEISYHGLNKYGKDGPLAKLGLDISVLYHEYQAFKCNNSKSTFETQVYGTYKASDDTTGTIRGESIVGDILASETATVEKLANDLKDIGVEVTAGPIEDINSNIVSAKIPIDKLPAVAQLDSVRGFIPARATTNTSGGNVIAD